MTTPGFTLSIRKFYFIHLSASWFVFLGFLKVETENFVRANRFHQCSSHHFISSFSLFDKDNQERPDLSSPKLPGSVSGSRGKHYKKQSWAEATGITSGINASPAESDLLQHPIKLVSPISLLQCSNAFFLDLINRVCITIIATISGC